MIVEVPRAALSRGPSGNGRSRPAWTGLVLTWLVTGWQKFERWQVPGAGPPRSAASVSSRAGVAAGRYSRCPETALRPPPARHPGHARPGGGAPAVWTGQLRAVRRPAGRGRSVLLTSTATRGNVMYIGVGAIVLIVLVVLLVLFLRRRV